MTFITRSFDLIQLTGWLLLVAIFLMASADQAMGDKISNDREALDKTEFAEEKAAQRHGQIITAIWDELRKRSSNYPQVGTSLAPASWKVPTELKFSSHWDSAFGKILMAQPGLSRSLTGDSFAKFLSNLREEGWRLDESEFHHLAFDSAKAGVSAQSTLNITLHASKKDLRVILRGKVQVAWAAAAKGTLPKIAKIDATQLSAWSRRGRLPFKPVLEFRTSDISPDLSGRLLPLFVDDINGDGLPEIALGGADILLRNQGKFQFKSTSPLLNKSASLSAGFAIADFNGDGHADLLAAGFMDSTLRLHLGKPKARNTPNESPFGTGKKCFATPLPAPQCIAVADVDGDGDLDAFVGQYKAPYQAGNMPMPFYDANDGFPSYLLINNGRGEFRDATETAGLAAKRNRRTYAASFVDFDGDSHLDLVVTSDFAGVDIYQGNGKGQFVDRTKAWLNQPHLFGMSHVLSDMNRDGLVDLYAVGMASTTARRLERMKLGRETEQEVTRAPR